VTDHKTISLAIQGGGSYGAYGWGVLDRLLQEPGLQIDALSGSSAGAINAVVVADGYAHGGGREGARRALDLAGPTLEGPLTLNPLRHFLAATIDFERVRACEELQLFIAATNVRTGTGKLFRRDEMDVQRLLASACLPTVFAAVEVDGEMYWDGSYVANPPLAPLMAHGDGTDVVIIQNNPIARPDMPRTVADIANRANEIAFNISFVREVSAVQFLGSATDEMRGAGATPAAKFLHLISGNEHLAAHGISAKFSAEMPFLQHLHDLGVASADTWLKENGAHLGVRSTLDPIPVFYADR